MEIIQVQRRVERVRYELRMREVTVAQVEPLGSEFIRIVFNGDSLVDFESRGFDDHVKFMAESGAGEVLRRDYSPRRFDRERRLLTIDFALHGDGFASQWARHAKVGQHAQIGGPRGSMIVPLDYDWHLLVGDATAVPAIARRLAELPAQARAIVVVQLDDLAALEIAHSVARIELQQVTSTGQLLAAVEAMQLPAGEGYAWCAGEASTMARIREVLINEKSHPREAMRVAAYWKRGASGFHEDLGR